VLRPYKVLYGNDPMEVVRHDHKFMKRGLRKMHWNCYPTFSNESAEFTGSQARPDDPPK